MAQLDLSNMKEKRTAEKMIQFSLFLQSGELGLHQMKLISGKKMTSFFYYHFTSSKEFQHFRHVSVSIKILI